MGALMDHAESSPDAGSSASNRLWRAVQESCSSSSSALWPGVVQHAKHVVVFALAVHAKSLTGSQSGKGGVVEVKR